jgi:hypothetical protein
MLIGFSNTVSSAIMRVSLTRIGNKAIDEGVNAVCVMQPSAHACWLLRDVSDECENIVSNLFHKPCYFYYAILYNARSHKNATIAVQQD